MFTSFKYRVLKGAEFSLGWPPASRVRHRAAPSWGARGRHEENRDSWFLGSQGAWKRGDGPSQAARTQGDRHPRRRLLTWSGDRVSSGMRPKDAHGFDICCMCSGGHLILSRSTSSGHCVWGRIEVREGLQKVPQDVVIRMPNIKTMCVCT